MRIMTTVMIYDLAVKKLTYQYFTSLLNIYVYICVYVCVCVYTYDFSVDINPVNVFSPFFAVTT